MTALDAAKEKYGGWASVARVMGGENDKGIINNYRRRFLAGQSAEAGDIVWSRFWKALGPFLPSEYAPRGTGPAKGQGGVTTHPCADKPPELSDLCAHWADIPEETREIILATARVAIKKCKQKAAAGGLVKANAA